MMNRRIMISAVLLMASWQMAAMAHAHPGGHGESRARQPIQPLSRLMNAESDEELPQQSQIRAINWTQGADTAAKELKKPVPAQHFSPFEKQLQLRWDKDYLYVGSNGIPDHPLMVGIVRWQQQVPLPQKYFGDNAWRVPLNPVPAREPATTKNRFLRGAIALAINGVPIFNPLNNRGEDAYLIGELDEYGGHCGRADDYHYHLPPLHLQKMVGRNQPIAYALDGYPIYGYVDERCADCGPLDGLNGHKDQAGNYHYHSTKKYPYMNGGFYGEVVEREGQVDPQPRATGVRPALTALRDAKITGFTEVKAGSFRLTYDVRGKNGTVSYTLLDDGRVKFEFVEPNGKRTEDTYSPRRGGGGGGGGRGAEGEKGSPRGPESGQGPPREGKGKLPEKSRVEAGRPNERAGTVAERNRLQVFSASVNDRGFIDVACTCDGAGQTPAVSWKGAPDGTKCFVVTVWHTAPDQEKSYWLVYNIPATENGWRANTAPAGKVGLNDKRKASYDPMCSKGPGVKEYHVTVYALSDEVAVAADKATRANLLAAIRKTTLAEGTLTFKYERK